MLVPQENHSYVRPRTYIIAKTDALANLARHVIEHEEYMLQHVVLDSSRLAMGGIFWRPDLV